MGDKTKFVARLIIYIGLTFGVPVGLICANYGLWKDGGFTIAGLLIMLIVGCGAVKIGSMFKEALWWRWWVQLILAVSTSVWIIAIYFVADIISVNIELVKKIALISFFSVLVGKAINPLPQLADKLREEKQIGTIKKAMK